ncbi:serine/threonine protein kinase [Paenibacillus glycanilyticus]|uniref:serine/threonine protein kinase n=1 Tax=Paenibacillus glycanilyticus TaxID=126569 RepID=UPI00203C1606|nr:serine/threonine protein kinase [Paenibacillus glycanilyticus]MCM3628483.1 serine/threonine protein kinase [Paenibacillus glycanilyticus]
MIADWKQVEEALKNVEVIGHENNKPVSVIGYAEDLRCIGIGTDAAVFYYPDTPNYAYKVYSAQALEKKEVEFDIYKRLSGSPYFPECYGTGDNYLVLSFEQGITLYDCLLQGVRVNEQVIQDVENAREFIRSRGLNPRDIHLKNVLLQEGRGKVLDVSEYIKEGNDSRWEHLVWTYKHFYPLISEVKVPLWILETITNWYNRIDTASFGIEDFSKRVSQLFFGKRK